MTVLALFITLMVVELSRDEGNNAASFADLASIKVDVHLPTALAILIFAFNF